MSLTCFPSFKGRIIALFIFSILVQCTNAQWDPYAGVVPSYTDGATVITSSGGSGEKIIDGNTQTSWQSGGSTPVLPFGFLSRDDLNILLGLGSTGQFTSSGSINGTATTDTDPGNNVGIPEVNGKSWVAFDLGGTTSLRSISLKCNTANPVDIYVFKPNGDSILVASYYASDNFSWKRYSTVHSAVTKIKLHSNSGFALFEAGALADYPTEYAIIDMGQLRSVGYIVTRHWANGTAVATRLLSSVDGNNWTTIGNVNPDALKKMNTRPSSPVQARYLKVEHSMIETDFAKAFIWEVDAYDEFGPYGPFPPPQQHSLTVAEINGVCGIWGWGHDEHADELGPNEGAGLFSRVATHARNYHPLHWDVPDPDMVPNYNVMATSGQSNGSLAMPWLNWDREYLGWNAAGLKAQVTLKFKQETPPVEMAEWDDPYQAAYNYGYAFAEHFGPTNGNGAVDVFEIGNEPWYYPDTFYMEVFQGMLDGAKAADPALKLLPCAMQSEDPNLTFGPAPGLTQTGSNFTGARLTETAAQMVDGLNVHYYSFTSDDDGTRIAVHPEHPETWMRAVLNDIRFRDVNMPGKKIYLSEWGWDSDGAGESCNFGECVSEHEQAIYAVRGAMMFNRFGVDRLTWYFFGNQGSGNLYSRSGFVGSKDINFQLKKSFYAFESYIKLLGDTYFLDTLREDDNAWIYAFGDSLGNMTHIAAWRPVEGADSSFANINLPIGYDADSAWIIRGHSSSGTLTSNPIYNSGSLQLNISPIPLIVKLKPTSSVNQVIWTGNNGSDWNDINNWNPPQIPTAVSDVLIPGSLTNYPATYSGNVEINSLTIDNSGTMSLVPGSDLTVNNTISLKGTLTVTGTAGTAPHIYAKGNWQLDGGTFQPGNGKVIIGGGLPQSLLNTVTFNDLEIINNTILECYNPITINGVLEVKSGSTLKSNRFLSIASGASVMHGEDTPNGNEGTVTGPVEVKRTGNNDPTIYNYWSSPVSAANVSALGSSLYRFDPNSALDTSTSGLQSGWVTASGIMQPARGYISRGGGTVSFKGTLNSASIGNPYKIQVTKNHGTTNQVPFNLVGNPFPSAIDAQLFIDKNGPNGNNVIAGGLYFWDDDGTGGGGYSSSQDYAVWSGAGSITGPNSGLNFDGHIASGQSFFVIKLNDGANDIVFDNSMRTAKNDAFFRQAPIERLWVNVLSPSGAYNETLIAFLDDATDGKDHLYDAVKLKGNANISLYSLIQGRSFAIQALAPLQGEKIVPLGVYAGEAGIHTLQLKEIEYLDETVTVILEDTELGVFQNLRVNPDYAFHANAGNHENRFSLHFNPALNVEATNVDCDGNAGSFTLLQSGSTQWSYLLTDQDGLVVSNGTGLNGQLSIPNLNEGSYSLVLVDSFGYQVNRTIEIKANQQVTADFEPVNNSVAVNESLAFNNLSVGSYTYHWDFGDASTSNLANPVHTYLSSGQFFISLEAANDDCTDAISKEVLVSPFTGVPSSTNGDHFHVFSLYDDLYVKFNFTQIHDAQLAVFDLLGRPLVRDEVSTIGTQKFSFDEIASQYLLVRIKTEVHSFTKRIFWESR